MRRPAQLALIGQVLILPLLQDAEAGPSLLHRVGAGLAAAATVLSASLAVPQARCRAAQRLRVHMHWSDWV